ncbi:hypothetical protein [Marinilabilia rubra]|uniref:Uncharacterized protein n=1 Tax=Marinilabilia rubra TaxID=2162893 RepID=A0A2U2B352_9BACT|nr:hypothetical protein [Marinilabilia rubra]PWD97480.1 hypothetical protein DDZ16_20550 [Marinilabilia rubra]
METIINLAQSANWGLSTRNNDLFLNSAVELYKYVQKNGASILTKFSDSSELQMIGKAFSYFARFIDNGDIDINSVAAENSYYCLASSMIQNNFYAAPELFNLLDTKKELFYDKFKSVIFDDLQEQHQVPLNVIINSYPQQMAAQKEIGRLHPILIYYVISNFYDIYANKTKMPEDIIEYSVDRVDKYISGLKSSSSVDDTITEGKLFFNKVHKSIKNTLLSF